MLYPTRLRAIALRRPLATALISDSNPSRILVRASSLSAIHRGIRSSERAQYGAPRSSEDETDRPRRNANEVRPRPKGFASHESTNRSGGRSGRGKRASLSREPQDEFSSKFNARTGIAPRGISSFGRGSRDSFASRSTSKAMDGASNFRQQQKLRKKLAKKKEEEEQEDEDYRRTRRKRFTDPEFSFGKKSLVYRLKHGDLKEAASQLVLQEPVRPRSFRDARRDNARLEQESREIRRPASSEEPGQNDRDSAPMRSRPDDRDRGHRGTSAPMRSWQDDIDRGFRDTSAPMRSRQTERRGGGNEDYHGSSAPMRGRKKEMMPMTIKYTTAASQFLYGRSVVKAALDQGRRKLYNLYIYGGDNRIDSKDNTIMTRLARKHNIPITIVPNHEQRIMDKMSMGRPHNGFVLEASPLPQLPIKSLGRLEETTTRLGFHVELDFQMKEEEAINGTDTFVRRANDVMPKPFVLLLNEILDPGNLGGILRTASYLGVDAVGITTRGSSTLTPVVLKSAAGAVEEVSLFTVDDPITFIEESRKAGWKAYAAVAPPDRKLVRKHGSKFISTDAIEAKSPLNEDPCLLVLGNEGHGLSKEVKVASDYELSVPRFVQGSCVDSLNVSVAAGLLCHSFVKEMEVEKAEQKAKQNDVPKKTQQVIDLVARLEPKGTRNEAPQDESQEANQEKKKVEESKPEKSKPEKEMDLGF
ncbi:hypothetical protein B0J13DRAFT_551455 [Dactylonectria estremocensis]|uniref:rRNA methyltransferase 1, mitochondrial n=1 Tax=Dactylonectria estremocensis TaxID=1079267 RepID=A0A9P9J8K1_9HYPO|nr:hypothetical protein B0J13DRAFT_551455 [Dactylonectria estremocensis]